MSDRAELDRVIETYMAGRYEECSSELGHYLSAREKDRFREPAVIEKARLYYSTCLLLLGEREQAREALLLALQENPLMQSPDSLTFPPPVVSLFLEVRDEVQQLIAEREREQVADLRRENERARRKAEARLRREQELEQLAQVEFVVARNSRWIAMLPFGAGQFQNGNVALGGVFLGTEALLTATALASGVVSHVIVARARSQGCSSPSCVSSYNEQTRAAYTVMTVSTWSLLGVAVLGIAEAQWHFKAERQLEVRKRPLPKHLQGPVGGEDLGQNSDQSRSAPRLRVAPVLSAGPGGGYVGIRGQF